MSGEWHRNGEEGVSTRVSAYAIDYALTLFSNFTYALERPAQGDQFSQRDRRTVLGLNASHAQDHALFGLSARSEAGLQLPRTEFFFNAGRGFHSNDARGATVTVDPRSGDSVNKVPGLVTSRGMELGARTEWLPGLQSSIALWRLDFDSELVYVGDAGATEANRPSKRHGVEWNNRWMPWPWLLVDADMAWTHARFADSDGAGDRIPNAVDKVGSVAVTLRDLGSTCSIGASTTSNTSTSRSCRTARLRRRFAMCTPRSVARCA